MAKSILIYGVTGSYKTTQSRFLAKYIYKKYGKKIRVIYTGASDGGLTDPEERAGILESFRLGLRSNPLPVLRRLAKGYWPRVVTKDGKQTLQLVEPTAQTWQEVGAIVLDSLSMGAEEGMRDTVDKGRPMAQEAVTPFRESVQIVDQTGKVLEVEEVFAAPALAHYGFGQNFAVGLINALSSLPVEIVMFTAMEKKGEEEDASGRSTIYGPDMPGKKLTPKIGGLVGDLIHFDQYFVEELVPSIDPATNKPIMKDNKPLMEKVLLSKTRAYFVKHPDSKTGITFPAKPRIVSSKWPELLKKWPGGYFEPTLENGIDMYLEEIDRLTNDAADSTQKWREEIDKQMGRTPKPAAQAQGK
jgi:hypothetical protein